MPVFAYEIRDANGVLKKNLIEAQDVKTATQKLQEQKFTVLKIQEHQVASNKADLREWWANRKAVDAQAIAVFSRQFATMINSGLGLARCLDILAEQTEDKKLQRALILVRRSVESGAPISNAMAEHPTVFSSLFINMVRAGEMGGVLDEVLNRLAEFMEKDNTLKKKVKGAMTYPVVIGILAGGIVVFLVTFILPTFVELFEGMKLTLPITTKILIGITKGSKDPKYLFPFFVIVGFLLFVFKKYTSTPIGHKQLDLFKLNAPVFGPLTKKICIARFARTLGTLIASGVPILQALEIVGKASGNDIIANVISTVRDSIREGESITKPLKASAMFPPMTIQMISVGEETGTLDAMLSKVADFYEVEVEAALEGMTSMLEPIMIVAMGCVVGFIVVSVFMPLFSLVNEMGK